MSICPKPKPDSFIILAIVIGVVIIELAAMFNGIDGKGVAISLFVLGGLGGIKLKDIWPSGK